MGRGARDVGVYVLSRDPPRRVGIAGRVRGARRPPGEHGLQDAVVEDREVRAVPGLQTGPKKERARRRRLGRHRHRHSERDDLVLGRHVQIHVPITGLRRVRSVGVARHAYGAARAGIAPRLCLRRRDVVRGAVSFDAPRVFVHSRITRRSAAVGACRVAPRPPVLARVAGTGACVRPLAFTAAFLCRRIDRALRAFWVDVRCLRWLGVVLPVVLG